MASKQLAVDNTSVRAKSKAGASDASRKTVFRPVLDNPHTVEWPPLSAPIRKLILDELVAFLETPLSPDDLPIADWRPREHARRRGRVHGAGKGKGKAEAGAAGGEKAAPTSGPSETQASSAAATAEPAPPGKTHSVTLRSKRTVDVPDYVEKPPTKRVPPPAPLPRPQLLNHLSVGINEVTRALETRIRWGRWELGDASAAPGGGAVAAAAASDPAAPAPASKRRRTHSAHLLALPPLDPLHPVAIETLQRASYRFLAHPLPKPTTHLPPYLLPPSEENPFFRVLANEHSLKLRQEKANDAKLRASQLALKKRDIQLALLGDVIQADHDKFEKTLLAKAVPDVTSRKRSAKQPATPVTGGQEATAAPSAATPTPLEAVSVKATASANSKAHGASEDANEPDWVSMIDIIFVCKPDINPPSLVEHLPNMVGAANAVMEATKGAIDSTDTPAASSSNMDVDPASDDTEGTSGVPRPVPHGVYLVQLDVGAELKLGDVLALRRVAALGLSSLASGTGPLLALISQHVQPISAPWLIPHVSNPTPAPASGLGPVRPPRQLIPTHVKHLRTSAPKDTKAANVATKLARQKAKKRKRGEEPEVYVAED